MSLEVRGEGKEMEDLKREWIENVEFYYAMPCRVIGLKVVAKVLDCLRTLEF